MMSRGKKILELSLAMTAKENNPPEKEELEFSDDGVLNDEDSHHSWSDDSVRDEHYQPEPGDSSWSDTKSCDENPETDHEETDVVIDGVVPFGDVFGSIDNDPPTAPDDRGTMTKQLKGPASWKKNISNKRRMEGESFTARKKMKLENGSKLKEASES